MTDQQKKINALKDWKRGDNSAAAKIVFERHGIKVTKHALRSWRVRETNSSPLSAIYCEAFQEAAERRKSKTAKSASNE